MFIGFFHSFFRLLYPIRFLRSFFSLGCKAQQKANIIKSSNNIFIYVFTLRIILWTSCRRVSYSNSLFIHEPRKKLAFWQFLFILFCKSFFLVHCRLLLIWFACGISTSHFQLFIKIRKLRSVLGKTQNQIHTMGC